jgi:hypothetical protein
MIANLSVDHSLYPASVMFKSGNMNGVRSFPDAKIRSDDLALDPTTICGSEPRLNAQVASLLPGPKKKPLISYMSGKAPSDWGSQWRTYQLLRGPSGH